MAYVDSNSTRAEVQAALADNASWLVDQDLEKAKAYVVAATVWLNKFAFDRSETGPSKIQFDSLNKEIAAQRREAQQFVQSMQAALPSPGSVVRLSVRDFRR